MTQPQSKSNLKQALFASLLLAFSGAALAGNCGPGTELDIVNNTGKPLHLSSGACGWVPNTLKPGSTYRVDLAGSDPLTFSDTKGEQIAFSSAKSQYSFHNGCSTNFGTASGSGLNSTCSTPRGATGSCSNYQASSSLCYPIKMVLNRSDSGIG